LSMDEPNKSKSENADTAPSRDRNIPRGTDEHSEGEKPIDDRAATTRPRSGTRSEEDAEQDL
ncbi:MAG TPA: hypothetical protein VM076_20350, partial [Gemmatimonadaceae bacterium]|nr:hypothetical protein [Gemmatimonadaceae bacterium]